MRTIRNHIKHLSLKALVVIVVAACCDVSLMAVSPIVSVKKVGKIYNIIGERGRRLGQFTPPAHSDFIGSNSVFAIMRSGDKYLFYDNRGRMYNSVDTLDIPYPIIAVTAYTFTAGCDTVTITYGKDGEMLSLRRHLPVETADNKSEQSAL